MFAVIKTGGKQYKVAKDQILTIEKLAGDAGDNLAFEDVLMLGDGDKTTVGTPQVAGATVTAEVLEQTRGPKVIVFKKNRRKNYRRRNGHRQDVTVVRITDILTDGKKPAAKAKAKAKKAEPVEAEGAETPAEPKTAAKKAPAKKPAAKKAAPKKTAAKKTEAKDAAADSAKPAADDQGKE